MFVEPGLEDEDGGNLIDQRLVLLAVVAGLVEDLMSLGAGQPFIPQMDGELGKLTELGGKGLILESSGADFAAHVQGIAHHDGYNFMAAAKAGNRTQILARTLAVEGHQGLSGPSKGIGKGNAYALGANVEAHQTGLGLGCIGDR